MKTLEKYIAFDVEFNTVDEIEHLKVSQRRSTQIGALGCTKAAVTKASSPSQPGLFSVTMRVCSRMATQTEARTAKVSVTPMIEPCAACPDVILALLVRPVDYSRACPSLAASCLLEWYSRALLPQDRDNFASRRRVQDRAGVAQLLPHQLSS